MCRVSEISPYIYLHMNSSHISTICIGGFVWRFGLCLRASRRREGTLIFPYIWYTYEVVSCCCDLYWRIFLIWIVFERLLEKGRYLNFLIYMICIFIRLMSLRFVLADWLDLDCVWETTEEGEVPEFSHIYDIHMNSCHVAAICIGGLVLFGFCLRDSWRRGGTWIFHMNDMHMNVSHVNISSLFQEALKQNSNLTKDSSSSSVVTP